jgi:hypothetical protein
VRPQSLIVLVVALVCAAVAVVVMGSFQPLPLFLGLIAMGAWRSWRVSRANAASGTAV